MSNECNFDNQFDNEDLNFVDAKKAYRCFSHDHETSGFNLLMKHILMSLKQPNLFLKVLADISKCDINSKTEDGFTALHIACANCKDTKIVKLLLDKGANVNLQSNCGNTPLMHMIECNNINGEIMKLLLEYNTNVNIQCNIGDSALMKALINFKLTFDTKGTQCKIMKLLLEYNADVHLANKERRTPLQFAQILDDKYIMVLFERYITEMFKKSVLDDEDNMPELDEDIINENNADEMIELPELPVVDLIENDEFDRKIEKEINDLINELNEQFEMKTETLDEVIVEEPTFDKNLIHIKPEEPTSHKEWTYVRSEPINIKNRHVINITKPIGIDTPTFDENLIHVKPEPIKSPKFYNFSRKFDISLEEFREATKPFAVLTSQLNGGQVNTVLRSIFKNAHSKKIDRDIKEMLEQSRFPSLNGKYSGALFASNRNNMLPESYKESLLQWFNQSKTSNIIEKKHMVLMAWVCYWIKNFLNNTSKVCDMYNLNTIDYDGVITTSPNNMKLAEEEWKKINNYGLDYYLYIISTEKNDKLKNVLKWVIDQRVRFDRCEECEHMEKYYEYK